METTSGSTDQYIDYNQYTVILLARAGVATMAKKKKRAPVISRKKKMAWQSLKKQIQRVNKNRFPIFGFIWDDLFLDNLKSTGFKGSTLRDVDLVWEWIIEESLEETA